jgi:hypothetical protein
LLAVSSIVSVRPPVAIGSNLTSSPDTTDNFEVSKHDIADLPQINRDTRFAVFDLSDRFDHQIRQHGLQSVEVLPTNNWGLTHNNRSVTAVSTPAKSVTANDTDALFEFNLSLECSASHENPVAVRILRGLPDGFLNRLEGGAEFATRVVGSRRRDEKAAFFVAVYPVTIPVVIIWIRGISAVFAGLGDFSVGCIGGIRVRRVH